MLCQSCGKKEANFHYTSNENGKVTELHLCHECAAEKGLLDDSFKSFNPFSLFEDSGGMFDSLLGGLLAPNGSTSRRLKEAAVCPFCGMRINEFLHGGKAGCAKCYVTFKEAVEPTVKKLHGNTAHTGKKPKGFLGHRTKKDKKAELEKLLKQAIETQEYEKAAEYRDALRALENEAGSDNAENRPNA